MVYKRKYDVSYVKFGFTSLNDHGVEKVQCVLCVLSNESFVPGKLRNHLEKNLPELKDKSIEYFKRLESCCKRQLNFKQAYQKLTEASFVVSQIIGNQKSS